nr:hypothetical protein [Tanacetum cinerariifolium]
MPPKLDLVFADEYVVSEYVTSLPDITKSKVKTCETKIKNVSAPIIKDWVSDSEDENKIKTESKQIKPSFAKEKFVKSTEHVKSPKKFVKQEERNRQTRYPRKISQSPKGDGKKIIVNEASIRRDLRLDDAEGTTCLPNATIFEELARMRVITPLFETMMVQGPEEVGEIPTDTQDTPILTQPSSSQPIGSINLEESRGRKLRDCVLIGGCVWICLGLIRKVENSLDGSSYNMFLSLDRTPPEVDKQSCTSLLLDLLAQKGYTDERDDIINIVSLRKYYSRDTHFNPLKSKPKRQNQFGLPLGKCRCELLPHAILSLVGTEVRTVDQERDCKENSNIFSQGIAFAITSYESCSSWHTMYTGNIVTNSRETPSWREIVSLTVLVKLASFT